MIDAGPVAHLPDDEHPVAVYLTSLAAGSRRAMRSALERIAEIVTRGRHNAWTLPWAQLRYPQVNAVRTILVERYQVATARRYLSALKGVLKAAWRLQQIETDAYLRAIDVPPIRGTSIARGRALHDEEVAALFDACSAPSAEEPGSIAAEAERVHGARDAAIFAILFGVGLRRSEVVALDLRDFNRTTGALTTRKGKGNKARVGYTSPSVRAALNAWLELRGNKAGPLFHPLTRSGRILRRAMDDQAVMDILLKRSHQAGIDNCAPHDLRRTFITNLLRRGVDISTVQKMAGHENISTTQRYDFRVEDEKQAAAEGVEIPFSPFK
ncbi:MAG TPA: tyrosine-type recombinase/integrase [Abditibacteriaceae bacterium]